jgi:glycosyltransferase involved in cell wall biosynthesis
MTRVLFVVPCTSYFPSGVVRIEQYLDRLRADGVEGRVISYFSPAAERRKLLPPGGSPRHAVARAIVRVWSPLYIAWSRLRIAASVFFVDAIVVQWVVPPRWLSTWVAARTKRLVFDFDDAVFLAAPERTRAVVAHAWRVVAGSHLLYDYARPLNANTELIPSAVAAEQYSPSQETAPRRVPCIGWIGSVGTLPQLAIVAPALRQLAADGVPFELLLAGTGGRRDLLPDLHGVAVREVPSYTGDELPGIVDGLDIGIMPLEDTEWARGKCAMKALVYMAGGRPVVLSPVGENRYVVKDGENGFFADTTDEWVDRLARLLGDVTMRVAQGMRGRSVAVEQYSTTVCYRKLWDTVYSQI